MPLEAREINEDGFYAIINQKEGDFLEFKAKAVTGAALQETVVAFANADGGEIFIGIKDEKAAIGERRFDGFEKIEDANDLLQNCVKLINPSLIDARHEFLKYKNTFILSLSIPAKDTIYRTSAGKVFLRRGAQNLILTDTEIGVLEYSKGARKREEEVVNVDPEVVLDSEYIKEYCKRVPVLQSPQIFLKKEALIYNGKPRVAALVALADTPQSMMKCGVKIYRLQFSKTNERSDYKRAYLDPDNLYTIEGPAEQLVIESVQKVKEIMESMTFKQHDQDTKLRYPPEAIHELIANAILHRDYSIEDEVHIRIFDNQIEIVSPGGFPANVNPKNIKNTRYSRNPRVVRLLHKLPNKINKDLGEGIDTVINAMKAAKLSPPMFQEIDNYVVATLKHTSIASSEEQVLEYLKTHDSINNSEGRKHTGEEDKVRMKNVFLRLLRQKKIEIINPDAPRLKRRYRLLKEPNIEATKAV
jgi:ATP-dependent DNA helicase RecG